MTTSAPRTGTTIDSRTVDALVVLAIPLLQLLVVLLMFAVT